MPFSVRADRRLIRSTARSRRFVRVEITAPEAPRGAARIPVNLAFVIDRSGSMGGDKIRKAREAAIQGIRALRPEDRFAVVSFDDHVDVVVPSSPATPEARAAAEERIAGIGDRGSTDLHAGWLAGCEEVGRALRDDAVGRCLLLTDGQANAGVTAPHEILARAAALRQRRITTSAFGVGADFDEGLLAGIAEAGGGNFHFIEGASQIPEFIGAEVGEALAVTARDVVLVVEAGEDALVESLNDFPCTKQGDAWRVELGSLFGGQMLDPVLRLTLPGGTEGRDPRGARARRGSRGRPRRAERLRLVHLGGPRRERRPGARPPRGSPRGVPLRRAGRPRGPRAQPGRRLRGRAPRPEDVPRADPRVTPETTRSCRRSSASWRRRRSSTARRWTRSRASSASTARRLRLKSRPAPSAHPPAAAAATRSSSSWRPGPSTPVVRRRPRAPRPGRPALFGGRGPARRSRARRRRSRARSSPPGDEIDLVYGAAPVGSSGAVRDRLHEAPPGRQLVLALARAAPHRGRLDGRLERLVRRRRRGLRRLRDRPPRACGSWAPRTRPRSSCTTTPAGASSTSARARADVKAKLVGGAALRPVPAGPHRRGDPGRPRPEPDQRRPPARGHAAGGALKGALMLKEALSVRCTVCGWSSAGRLAEVEPRAEAHARTGHAVLLRLPPAPTRRNVAGTTGADLGHYTATGFVAARPQG